MGVVPIQLLMTPPSMATAPKTTKNTKTATESSSTWTACATTRARTRFAFSSPTTRVSTPRSVRSAARSRAASSSGRVDAPVDDLLGAHDVVDDVELLAQPGDQEEDGSQPEEQHRAAQHAPLEGMRDLPDLGVDEEERHEEQQHRQRPRHEGHEEPEAGEGPARRPPGDGGGLQRAQRVERDQSEGDDPAHREADRAAAVPGGDAGDHACRDPDRKAHQQHPDDTGRVQPAANLGADVVDEVGQSVLAEPASPRRARRPAPPSGGQDLAGARGRRRPSARPASPRTRRRPCRAAARRRTPRPRRRTARGRCGRGRSSRPAGRGRRRTSGSCRR